MYILYMQSYFTVFFLQFYLGSVVFICVIANLFYLCFFNY